MKKTVSKSRTTFPKSNTDGKSAQKVVRGKKSQKSGTEKKKPKKTTKTKTIVKKKVIKKEIKKPELKPKRYFEAVGRRKTAIARVRLFTQGEKKVLVNGEPYQIYFSILENQQTAIASLDKMKSLDRFSVLVKVKGGGLHAQAEAVRHGIARALLKFSPDFRKKLRKAGFLTRDPRMRERKKFGLKRARRAPQWRKR